MEVQTVTAKPLHDRIIVKPDATETVSRGGIIIPDTAQEAPKRGTIVAVGPGYKDEPVKLKVGERVMYSKYGGTEIELDEGSFVIMRETDAMLILHDEKAPE